MQVFWTHFILVTTGSLMNKHDLHHREQIQDVLTVKITASLFHPRIRSCSRARAFVFSSGLGDRMHARLRVYAYVFSFKQHSCQ